MLAGIRPIRPTDARSAHVFATSKAATANGKWSATNSVRAIVVAGSLSLVPDSAGTEPVLGLCLGSLA